MGKRIIASGLVAAMVAMFPMPASQAAPGGPRYPLIPLLPLREDCIAFNPAQLDVIQANGSWKVVSGSQRMIDFGPNEARARAAEVIILRSRAVKTCYVGRPNASLTYLVTAAGQLPVGPWPGEDCVTLNPTALTVQNVGGNWTVVSEGDHLAFTAPTQAEANTIVRVLRKYGATKSCFVGRPNPPFTYLR